MLGARRRLSLVVHEDYQVMKRYKVSTTMTLFPSPVSDTRTSGQPVGNSDIVLYKPLIARGNPIHTVNVISDLTLTNTPCVGLLD